MKSYRHKLLGDKTPRQVAYWARKMLGNPKIKIGIVRDKTNTCWSGITVGGHFDPDEDKDINIYIMFRSNCETVFYGLAEVEVLLNELLTTYIHEKRHKYQYRQRGDVYTPAYRKFKNTDEKIERDLNYYADPDELDAYALESAIEDRLEMGGFIKAKYHNSKAFKEIRINY